MVGRPFAAPGIRTHGDHGMGAVHVDHIRFGRGRSLALPWPPRHNQSLAPRGAACTCRSRCGSRRTPLEQGGLHVERGFIRLPGLVPDRRHAVSESTCSVAPLEQGCGGHRRSPVIRGESYSPLPDHREFLPQIPPECSRRAILHNINGPILCHRPRGTGDLIWPVRTHMFSSARVSR